MFESHMKLIERNDLIRRLGIKLKLSLEFTNRFLNQ